MATETAVDVVMPQMGVSVSEGTITRWLKQEGEQVEADEPLLEISTDKVDTEVPSPASGTLTQVLVQEGETVDVGTKLGQIGGQPAAPRLLRRPRARARAASHRRPPRRPPRPRAPRRRRAGAGRSSSGRTGTDGQRKGVRVAGRRTDRVASTASIRPRSRAPGRAAA